jgi:cephalosporin hydroxylase
MSTESIYGDWDKKESRVPGDELEALWHKLAAQNVGRADFEPNSGLSQRKNEIIELWQLYIRSRPRVVVEVGCAQGGTFAGWCQLGVWTNTIIGIDRDVNDCRPRPGDPVHPDIYSGPLASTTNGGGMYSLAKHGQIIHPINGWTFDPIVLETLLHLLNGRKIDFLFHDASHEAGMFARDFKMFWPLISDGGILAVHDIMPSKMQDVTKDREWQRIREQEDYSALYEYRGARTDDSLGIGVLIK